MEKKQGGAFEIGALGEFEFIDQRGIRHAEVGRFEAFAAGCHFPELLNGRGGQVAGFDLRHRDTVPGAALLAQ